MFDLENRWWRIENTLVGRQQIDGTACLRHCTTKLQVHYTIITRKCARNVVSQQTRPRRVVFIGVKWMMMLPPTFLPEEHSLGSQPDKLNSTFTPPFNYMLTGKCYARRKYNHIFMFYDVNRVIKRFLDKVEVCVASRNTLLTFLHRIKRSTNCISDGTTVVARFTDRVNIQC